jgi:hypothetical protein
MNYTNFTEYWEFKKELFILMKISKEQARIIWNDAVDCFSDCIYYNIDSK